MQCPSRPSLFWSPESASYSLGLALLCFEASPVLWLPIALWACLCGPAPILLREPPSVAHVKVMTTSQDATVDAS